MELQRTHFKILASWMVLACGIAAQADPPRDEASLWTEFGPDLLTGSITARRHFQKPESAGSELLFSRRKQEVAEEDEGAAAGPRRRWRPEPEASEVAWRLGYAYARPSVLDRAVFDFDSHSALLGIDWESSRKNLVQFSVSADFAPTLGYKQGAFLLRVAHSDRAPWQNVRPARETKSAPTTGEMGGAPVVGSQTLHSAFGGFREEEETASQYFRRHSRIYGDPLGTEDAFNWEPPVYTAALLFEAHSHSFAEIASVVGTPGTPATSLSQIGIGPELDLRADENWSFGISGRFFFYGGLVVDFLGKRTYASTYYATLPSASGAVSGGLEGSVIRPWAFTFPDMIFEQSIAYDVDDDLSFGLNANETFYVIDGQPIGLGGTLWGRYAIDDDWQIAAGGELVFNSAAVNFAGFLNLSYLF